MGQVGDKSKQVATVNLKTKTHEGQLTSQNAK